MASLYLRDQTYYINWREGGTRYRKSLGRISSTEAEEIRQLTEARITQRRFSGETLQHTNSITLREFSRDYLLWRETEYPASQARTQEAMNNHILPEFGDTPMREISPYQVEKWKVKRRAKHAAPATIKKELDVLKAALNRAVAWELIPSHRVARVSPPKLLNSRPPRYFEPEELQAIYDNSVLYGSLWKFVANTGMRRGEILKARRRDIVDGVIRIESTEANRTKSGEWRPVPLSPGALEALKDLPDDYLAPQLHINSLGRAFIRDCKSAGLSGSIHDLRHTFCSMLVMRGVGLKTVQQLAGHASYNTTLKYAHLSETHLTSAVDVLDI